MGDELRCACRRCKRMLPVSEFGADPRVKSGRKARCRDCCAKACRDSYAKHPRERAARQAARPVDPASRRASAKLGARNHPEARAARERIKRLIQRGSIPSARSCKCHDCGEPATAYDHHLGYEGENAIRVQPVCSACHGERDRARGEHIRRPDPLAGRDVGGIEPANGHREKGRKIHLPILDGKQHAAFPKGTT